MNTLLMRFNPSPPPALRFNDTHVVSLFFSFDWYFLTPTDTCSGPD